MTKTLRLLAAVAATATALAASSPAQANLVNNAGFETGDLTGWTLVGDPQTNFVSNGPGVPHSGTYGFFTGQFGAIATLSQNIQTTIGQTYDISFWLANAGGTPNFFNATLGGIPIMISRTDENAFGFLKFTADFTATSSVSLLLFQARQDPNYWALDDISIVAATPSTVPIPGALPLLASGLASLGWFAFRRRRQTPA